MKLEPEFELSLEVQLRQWYEVKDQLRRENLYKIIEMLVKAHEGSRSEIAFLLDLQKVVEHYLLLQGTVKEVQEIMARINSLCEGK